MITEQIQKEIDAIEATRFTIKKALKQINNKLQAYEIFIEEIAYPCMNQLGAEITLKQINYAIEKETINRYYGDYYLEILQDMKKAIVEDEAAK